MSFLRRPASWGLFALALTLPFLVGCDDDTLTSQRESDQNEIFDRYVSIGNSITAGFQANGISATTQNESYAVLLAEQMQTPFTVPELNDPGCPPPVDNIITGQSTAPGAPACALRDLPAPLVINNVAVPGAKTLDVLTNDAAASSANELTQFILGGETQIETAIEANPTFVSIWIGNNDVLGAALQGNTNLITDQTTFANQYTGIVDSLEAAGVENGALVSVANVAFIPHLSPGPAYLAAESQINGFGQQLAANDEELGWGSFDVLDTCAPGEPGAATRVPFAYGFGQLFQQALRGQNVQIDCAPSTAAAPLLTGPELAEVAAAVTEFNSFLQQLADDRGWAYVDVNPALGALYAAGAETPTDPSDDLVPKFPQADLDPSTPTFGAFFSEDGVHPSAATHRVVTNLFVESINEEYGTSLETIEAPSVPAPPSGQ